MRCGCLGSPLSRSSTVGPGTFPTWRPRERRQGRYGLIPKAFVAHYNFAAPSLRGHLSDHLAAAILLALGACALDLLGCSPPFCDAPSLQCGAVPGEDTERRGGPSQVPWAFLRYPDDCGVTWLLGVYSAPLTWQSTQLIVPWRFTTSIQGEPFRLEEIEPVVYINK